MTAKLNQILAVEKNTKPRCNQDFTKLYQLIQKADLFSGLSRNFQAINDDGEKLPPENKKVQLVAAETFQSAASLMGELWNITARKDWTNTKAFADVKVDGKAFLSSVPVTYLLFLEKQLTDVKTFISAVPVLDEADDWNQDTVSGLWKTAPVQTHRTTKIVEPLVLYPATDKHAAQVQPVQKDVISGYWTTVKQSGALTKKRKAELLERVETLSNAVKEAREAANMTEEVESPDVGATIFGYLFA